MERQKLYRGIMSINVKPAGVLLANTRCEIIKADEFKVTIQTPLGKFWLYKDEFDRDFDLMKKNVMGYQFDQDDKAINRNAINYKPSDLEPHSNKYLYSAPISL